VDHFSIYTARPWVLVAGLLLPIWQVTPTKTEIVAFTDVSVVDVEFGGLLANRTVIVGEGRIVAVGDAREVSAPAGSRVVDARGKFLIPRAVGHACPYAAASHASEGAQLSASSLSSSRTAES
jgi:hypothetical protein